MTGTPSLLADLLTDCEAHGIRLFLASNGGLSIDAPQDALTPERIGRLKAWKAGILELLLIESGITKARNNLPPKIAQAPAQQVCKCGSTRWHDVPIHSGQSVRRDCGRCRRFLDFPVWYGIDNGHKVQY